MCKGIMFLSLPVSTSYGSITLAWSDDVCMFADIAEHLLLKSMEFIFTIFTIPFGNGLFLVNTVHLSVSPTLAELFVVVDLPTCCALLPHRLGIIWAGSWNHSNCIFGSQAFMSVLTVVPQFASYFSHSPYLTKVFYFTQLAYYC